MPKKTKTTTQKGSQETKFDPTVTNLAVDNFNTSKNLGSSLTAYTGDRVADFNPTQTEAQGALTAIGRGTSDGLNQAATTAQGLSQFVAPKVSGTGYDAANASASQINRGAVRDVTAGQLKDTDLTGYLNPYTQNVVATSLADIERQREIQRVTDRNAAAGRGAYGGSRHGVADSLTNEAALRTSASTSANLRSAGYDRAVDAATGDINRRLGADTTNQNVDLNVAGSNASLAQQVALANAAATNRSREFGASTEFDANRTNAGNELAGAGIRQGGASLLAGLSAQQLQDELTRAGAISAVGDTQGAQTQAELDAAYQEYVRQQQLALAAQGLSTGALGAIPVGSTSNSKGTTEEKDPMAGLGSLVSLAGLAAAPFTGGASLAALSGFKGLY